MDDNNPQNDTVTNFSYYDFIRKEKKSYMIYWKSGVAVSSRFFCSS